MIMPWKTLSHVSVRHARQHLANTLSLQLLNNKIPLVIGVSSHQINTEYTTRRHFTIYRPCLQLGLPHKDDDKVLVRVFEQGKTLPHQQWVMRMNNQNGYLSWCRNSYLCLSVSVAILMSEKYLNQSSTAEVLSNITYESAVVGLVGISCFNLAFGSAEFIYQLLKTKPLTQISWLTVGIYSSFVILHALLFLKVAARMLPDDNDDEEEGITRDI